MSVTQKRKKEFAAKFLQSVFSSLGFADVGSGGKLKNPWNLLPESKMRKFDFEPMEGSAEQLPLCISNATGKRDFYVAKDERSSSLHEPSSEFAERFNQPTLRTLKTIPVQVTTLDEYFQGRYDEIDLIDINAEGHDFQVLEGASQLLESWVKLIKVEFELTQVWHGQGWFGDIDGLLRSKGYELADIDVAFWRPAKAAHIFHKGEPLWGKAFYVPGAAKIQSFAGRSPQDFQDAVFKSVILYALVNIPGRAFDVLDLTGKNAALDSLRSGIDWVFQYARWDNAMEKLAHIARFPMRLLK